MPELVAVEGPLAGQTFKLQKEVVLGRAFDADIRIDELTISRHHTRIFGTEQGLMVEDMGSGNGTFVNDQPIDSATPLTDGDLIRLSHSVFRFSHRAKPKKSATAVDIVDLSTSDESAIVETLDIKSTMMDLGAAPHRDKEPEAVLKAHRRLRTVVEISNKVTTQLNMDELLNGIMRSLSQEFFLKIATSPDDDSYTVALNRSA